MKQKHNLYGIIALILVLSLYIGIPESLFVSMAYEDYKTLNELGVITNFSEIDNYYQFVNVWDTLILIAIIVIAFYFINKQHKNSPSLINTIALILNIITSIVVLISAFALLVA